LGYGGTKEEMERLLDDAAKIDKDFDNMDMGYANIVKAIHIIQSEMGITGTTAREAATTIQGSLGMTKASWENLITGFSDPDADISELLINFTSSVTTFVENVVPAISQAIPSIVSGIAGLLRMLLPQIPPLIGELLPAVIEGVSGLVSSLTTALPQLLETLSTVLGEQAIPLVMALVTGILGMIPQLLETALQLVLSLAEGIVKAIPELLPAVVSTIDGWIKCLLTLQC
jgi:phage-related protein